MTTSPPLIPLRAPAPPPAPSVVRSSTHVLRVVSDYVADLVLHQHFTEPDSASAYADRGHLHFTDDAALGTAVAWAEQLDATPAAQVVVDTVAEMHAIRITGHVRGVEVWLHVATRAPITTSWPDLGELRRHVEADSRLRALSQERCRVSTVEGWRALVVPVAGPLRQVVISTEREGLPDLYRHTGAEYVEHVRGPGCSIWVDEEGAVVDPPRPANPRIDALLRRVNGWSIRGDVVVTGPADPEGSITSLDSEQVALLRKAIAGEP